MILPVFMNDASAGGSIWYSGYTLSATPFSQITGHLILTQKRIDMKRTGSIKSNSHKNNYMRVLSGLIKSNNRVNALSESDEVDIQVGYKFKINTDQDPSLQSWEEENSEYASWNLILDKHDSPSC